MVPRELFQPRVVRGDGVKAPNVLLVDDNDANLVALEATLSPLRCNLVYARSGSEALAHLLREEFALILMDVQMPGMDGYETARLVRARRKTQHVPIIFLTAHDYDASGIKRAYDLGAVDFLPKPLDIDVLRAKAQAFLALYERTLEVAELRAERALIEERARQEAEALARDMARFVEADRRNTELLALLADELARPLASLKEAIDPRAIGDLVRLTRVVDELRDITQISVGSLVLERTCVDLGAVVESALEDAQAQLAGRELALTPSPEAIAVEVDVAHLVHALVNVLGEAARVSPTGGTISVAWGREFGHAFVKITDAGGPAQLDKAFDLFAPSERGGGLNLGLALAKQLVDLHRGTLLAASAPAGTRFELRLPATEFPLDAARNRLVTARLRALERPRSLRVLVVAADDELGEVTTTLLIGRGHQVTRAPDARTALALIAEHRPDIALIDLSLLSIDGCEVVRLARALEPPLGTRFVAITDGTSAEADRATAGGFDRHLARPLVSSAIVGAVEAD